MTFLKPAEVAERLGVPVKAVYNMATDGRLQGHRFGRSLRFSSDDLSSIDLDALDYATAATGFRRRWTCYFVQCAATGLIKIGGTKNLDRRMAALRSGSPTPLALLGTVAHVDWPEAVLHRRFADAREHGEWFRPVEPLLQFIAEVVQ